MQEKGRHPPPAGAPLKFFLAAAFLYGICETVLSNSATIYLHTVKMLTFFESSAILALFWALVALGRGAVYFYAERFDSVKLCAIFTCMVALAFAALPYLSGMWMNLGAFAVAGLGCSAPLLLLFRLAEQRAFKTSWQPASILLKVYLVGCAAAFYGMGVLREEYAYSFDALYELGLVLALLLALLTQKLSQFKRA